MFLLTPFLNFLKRFYLFTFRERGREGKGEGQKHQCVVASHATPSKALAPNPGTRTDWESNQWPCGSQAGTGSTEPHSDTFKSATDHPRANYDIEKEILNFAWGKMNILAVIFKFQPLVNKVLSMLFYLLTYLFSVLGWHRLIRLYRFQVYISIIHDLYIALCALNVIFIEFKFKINLVTHHST